MFCYQCQEACKNSGCTVVGMCGKKANTADLMDQLITKLKLIAVALEATQTAPNREVGRFICQAVFTTITNANFDDRRLDDLIARANSMGKSLGVTEDMVQKVKTGILSCENEDIRSLRELLIYGVKGICAYADHAAILGKEDDNIYAFLTKALAATTKDLPMDELVQLVLECGNIAVLTMATLDAVHCETYGNPEISRVRLSTGNNPGILISGHDLKDMAELLEQTAGTGVDVYTHGEMLPAHYYPEFKKYPHLAGNYGGSWWRQPRDFASFNGPILMTTNCIVPVIDSYRERIFTTGMAGYPGIEHIADRKNGGKKDFSALIELAKSCPPPTEIESGEIIGGFAHNQVMALAGKIVEAVKSGAIKRFVVMAGCDGRHKEREYFADVARKLPADTVILTAGCAKYRYNKLDLGDINGIPRVLDAGQCNDCYSLAVIAMKLQEAFELENINDLPLSFDIAWYEQKAVAVLLALLALGVKGIRLGPTLPAFLSPNVASVLVENFDIKVTGQAADDVAAITAGK